MDKPNENFEIIKEKILEKYSNIFLIDKLINEYNYFFGNNHVKFNIVDIFCDYEKEIYRGIPNISIRIDSLDIKIQKFLESKNIEFEVRDDIMNTDIYIEELQYGEKSTQLILNILDFIYKNYL
jgi:hypothetical protein